MKASPATRLKLCETPVFQHYVQHLLIGDRPACRQVVEKAVDCGVEPRRILLELCWPAQEVVRELYREHKISLAAHHMATRLNRATVDRVCGNLPIEPANGRKVMLMCGDQEPEELGGQITADLFEAAGFEVKFLGGGIPNDEVLHILGHWRPDLLVLFATLPQEMPAARKLIDYLREVNGLPNLQVMCCGGIYKRAGGLAEEIGADLFACDADEAVQVALRNPHRRASAEQQTVGRSRRTRRAQQNKAGGGKPRPAVVEQTGDHPVEREAA